MLEVLDPKEHGYVVLCTYQSMSIKTFLLQGPIGVRGFPGLRGPQGPSVSKYLLVADRLNDFL